MLDAWKQKGIGNITLKTRTCMSRLLLATMLVVIVFSLCLKHSIVIGCVFSGLSQKLKLWGLVGRMLANMILHPEGLHLLSDKILLISPERRQRALIEILL